MKTSKELTREQLEDIAKQIQNILYYDELESAWNQDKAWGMDTLCDIAAVLASYGMSPSFKE